MVSSDGRGRSSLKFRSEVEERGAPSYSQGLVNLVPGLKRKGCPGILTPLSSLLLLFSAEGHCGEGGPPR